MKYLVIGLIKLYQIFLSPFIGRHCRYQPTCSRYTEAAVIRFGFWLEAGWGLHAFCVAIHGGTVALIQYLNGCLTGMLV